MSGAGWEGLAEQGWLEGGLNEHYHEWVGVFKLIIEFN